MSKITKRGNIRLGIFSLAGIFGILDLAIWNSFFGVIIVILMFFVYDSVLTDHQKFVKLQKGVKK